MNKLVFEQLNQVKSVDLIFDQDTTKLVIPKTTKVKPVAVKVGGVYKIDISDTILFPSESSTLASNWNGGKVPEYKRYLAEIISTMGNMVKVNGVAEDDSTNNFYGWLPFDGFEVLEKLYFILKLK